MIGDDHLHADFPCKHHFLRTASTRVHGYNQTDPCIPGFTDTVYGQAMPFFSFGRNVISQAVLRVSKETECAQQHRCGGETIGIFMPPDPDSFPAFDGSKNCFNSGFQVGDGFRIHQMIQVGVKCSPDKFWRRQPLLHQEWNKQRMRTNLPSKKRFHSFMLLRMLH